jgi:hypothetical protein
MNLDSLARQMDEIAAKEARIYATSRVAATKICSDWRLKARNLKFEEMVEFCEKHIRQFEKYITAMKYSRNKQVAEKFYWGGPAEEVPCLRDEYHLLMRIVGECLIESMIAEK